ncbi:hypothetical protein K7X08_034115 [Anisodus acutangulus]|uniref:Uncharacterized protein n=1 Tax=Anisodus acutangulus TaxID=402998 RepID=A0A9Q1M004_9SOLA|nr:hypothetical protein K7X08_034115 [Anisodus acutangulus]
MFRRGIARILSSGKVIGDPGNWNVVKDMRVFSDPSKSNESDVTTLNKFNILQEEEQINGSNKDTTIPYKMTRVKAVESSDDLEKVVETDDQVIDSAQSGEKEEDAILSTEDNEDEQKNVTDQQVNGNNDIEEVEEHNKELEVVVERMTGDMTSHNEELISKNPMPANAHAIVHVPQVQQILNLNPTSPMKELHDLVSHNIKEVVVRAYSDENEVDLNNTDTTEALSKALEHVVMEA